MVTESSKPLVQSGFPLPAPIYSALHLSGQPGPLPGFCLACGPLSWGPAGRGPSGHAPDEKSLRAVTGDQMGSAFPRSHEEGTRSGSVGPWACAPLLCQGHSGWMPLKLSLT